MVYEWRMPKFLKYFIQILKQVRANRNKGPDSIFMKHLNQGTLEKHFGYVDPSDPSLVFVSQPVDDVIFFFIFSHF